VKKIVQDAKSSATSVVMVLIPILTFLGVGFSSVSSKLTEIALTGKQTEINTVSVAECKTERKEHGIVFGSHREKFNLLKERVAIVEGKLK